MDFKRSIIVPLFLLMIVVLPGNSRADLNATMDSMFSSMINVTAPDAHISARRGIVDGGSVVVRNRVVTPQLIAFNPPKFAAGCGGVDAFLGSFSFINADQFVNLLRAIASNAISYSFQLALNEMCPSCSDLITKLRSAAGRINEWAGNSCQVAQAAVDFVGDKLPSEMSLSLEQGPVGSLARNVGSALDEFNVRFPTPGQVLPTKSLTPTELYDEGITGNVAFRILTEGGTSSASSWIVGNDSALVEELISLTGTVIITEPDPSDPDADEKPISTNIIPPLLAFQDFIGEKSESDEIYLYECATGVADCMEMNPAISTTFIPMADRVRYLLLGDMSTGDIGIINKFALNPAASSGGTFTADQRAFMDVLPDIAKNIRDLARTSSGAARVYGNEISEVVGLMLVEALIDELMTTVTLAAAKNPHKGLAGYQAQLNTLKDDINAQKQITRSKFNGASEVQKLYEVLMQTNKQLPNPTPFSGHGSTSG